MTQQPDRGITDADLMAYLDQSLTAARRAELEAALESDAAARARLAEWRRQNARIAALYQPAAHEPVPPRLNIRQIAARQRTTRQGWQRMAAAAVICLCIGAGGGWYLDQQTRTSLPAGPVVTALAAHRLYVQDVVHPVEVAGNADGALGVWLSKRLDRKFAVPDLEKVGWRLVGGSLLPVGTSAGAQIMYEDDSGRRLTLFFTPVVPGRDGTPYFASAGTLGIMNWTDRGLNCTIVAPIPRPDIKAVAATVYDQLSG